MEGPYYKRQSPQRTSLLEPGITGMKIVVTGSVLARDCQPIARTLVDLGHSNHWNGYALQHISVHMWSSGICGVYGQGAQ